MSPDASERWSLRRSLAFLAATFAIVFGAVTPAAVAASPALGQPIFLCSGDRLTVVYDADGRPIPAEPDGVASLTCAMALLAGLEAPPPPPAATPPPVIARAHVGDLRPVTRPAPVRMAPRPPSRGPPLT